MRLTSPFQSQVQFSVFFFSPLSLKAVHLLPPLENTKPSLSWIGSVHGDNAWFAFNSGIWQAPVWYSKAQRLIYIVSLSGAIKLCKGTNSGRVWHSSVWCARGVVNRWTCVWLQSKTGCWCVVDIVVKAPVHTLCEWLGIFFVFQVSLLHGGRLNSKSWKLLSMTVFAIKITHAKHHPCNNPFKYRPQHLLHMLFTSSKYSYKKTLVPSPTQYCTNLPPSVAAPDSVSNFIEHGFFLWLVFQNRSSRQENLECHTSGQWVSVCVIPRILHNFNSSLHGTGEKSEAAHNWAILWLSFGILVGDEWTTEENTSSTLETDRRNLLYIPSSSCPPCSHINELPHSFCFLCWSPAPLWLIETLLTHYRCHMWPVIIPAPHGWSDTYSRQPIGIPNKTPVYLLIPKCRGSPAICTLFEINLSHI